MKNQLIDAQRKILETGVALAFERQLIKLQREWMTKREQEESVLLQKMCEEYCAEVEKLNQ